MKRLLLITLLVLSHGPAYAEWLLVGKGVESGMTTYADPDTIRRKGELVQMWVLFDYKTVQTNAGKSFLSMRSQSQFDCADEFTQILSYTVFSGHMETGDILAHSDDKHQWQLVPPGSVTQTLWEVACDKQ